MVMVQFISCTVWHHVYYGLSFLLLPVAAVKVRADRRRLAARVQVWLYQLPNCVVDNWGVNWQLRYTLMTIKRHEATILSRRRRSVARQKISPASFLSPIVVAKFIFFAPNLLFLRILRQWRSVARTLPMASCNKKTCNHRRKTQENTQLFLQVRNWG